MLLRSICFAVITMAAVSCSDNFENSSPVGNSSNLRPADHTVSQSGRFHAPGLANPQENCAGCHGQNLRGGANGEPSCFLCHRQVWND
jgi:hypothetical protein